MNDKLILVTGGAGYIGSTLVEMLLEAEYEVVVLDRFFFGETHLQDLWEKYSGQLRLIKGDIRSVGSKLFEGVYAVCDLAAMSNDPAGDLDPVVTHSINHLGRARVAMMARERDVARYVLASSCSVYGFNMRHVHEGSSVNPLTAYAHANRRAEIDAMLLASRDFSVTVLRQATVYGLSPGRMRFDLAVNAMTRSAYEKDKIFINGDGQQWRPFVHVRDTASVFLQIIEADQETVTGKYFNVGSNDQNYQVQQLANMVSEELGGVAIEYIEANADDRSYNVDFQHIENVFGWHASYTPADAAREIMAGFQNQTLLEDSSWSTIRHYRTLLEANSRLFEPSAEFEEIRGVTSVEI